MKDIDLIALAGLLHDVGKFGQRADKYKLREGAYKKYDYRYTHAAYTAQILNDLVFNLGDEMSDAAAMHHNPDSELSWIIAAADRMASGFEREVFETYNALYDKEDFKKQRLWYLFDEEKRYKIAPLSPQNIYPQEGNAQNNEYDALWESFEEDMKKIEDKGNSSIDAFTIDYLLKKYTSFIPSSTSFKKGEFDAVKANIPLYEHAKATAIFASALYKLSEQNNHNIINYYKDKSGDMEQQDLLLIAGDFFGIQKFIFNSVPSAKASKILRAKSAYVQILTKSIAFYIVDRLGLSFQSIISTNAGKFEILGINDERSQNTLLEIQKELNTFFIGKYFGETGVGVSFTECSLADFIVKGRYKESLRKRVDQAVEASKFQKFDLQNFDGLMEIDEGLDNQNLCQLCNKKKGTQREQNDKSYTACDDCFTFVRIGEKLAKNDYLTISKNSGQIELFADYYINFSDEVKRTDNAIAIFDISNHETFSGYPKWELKSYVKTHQKQVVTFEELAQESCKGSDTGVKALMALKGDADSMGKYIKDSEVTNSFARYNFFARMVDYFFSVRATELMVGKDLYTVFAGGDDLFILGAWDEVIAYAKELREEFMEFAKGSDLTFSVGMVMTKPNKPINFVADVAEKALEEAKEYKKGEKEKDAITLFGETVQWEDYLDDLRLSEELNRVKEINTAFTYRLLELVQMSKNVKYHSKIEDTMWKSKLAYSFNRNMNAQKYQSLLNTLNEMIEDYPKETKMVLSEFIYKRRD